MASRSERWKWQISFYQRRSHLCRIWVEANHPEIYGKLSEVALTEQIQKHGPLPAERNTRQNRPKMLLRKAKLIK